MAHAQKPDFVFRRIERVHLNRQGRQFSRLLAAEVCAPAVVMLDTPCSEVVCRELATHSIRHFPLHFPSRASLCAITFQLDSTTCTSRYCGLVSTCGRPAGGLDKGDDKNRYFTRWRTEVPLNKMSKLNSYFTEKSASVSQR